MTNVKRIRINSNFPLECKNPNDFSCAKDLNDYLEILRSHAYLQYAVDPDSCSDSQDDDNHEIILMKPYQYINSGGLSFLEFLLKLNSKSMKIKSSSIVCKSYGSGYANESYILFESKYKGEWVKCAAAFVYRENSEFYITANKNKLNHFLQFAASEGVEGLDGFQTLHVFSNSAGVNEYTENEMMNGKYAFKYYSLDNVNAIIQSQQDFWKKYCRSLTLWDKIDLSKMVLQKHQKEAVDIMAKNIIGFIQHPTGTGKSIIISEGLRLEISMSKNKTPVFAIISPSIALSWQLLKTVSDYLCSYGVEAQYFNLSSGKFPEMENRLKSAMAKCGMSSRDIPSSTSCKQLIHYYETARISQVPFVVSSTYHSIMHLSENTDIAINCAYFDEAHNMVSGRFKKDFKKASRNLKSKKKFYFSATPEYTESDYGIGNNNKEIYGEIICSKSYKEMADEGQIVVPFLQWMEVNNIETKTKKVIDLEKHSDVMSAAIIEAWDYHNNILKKCSAEPSKIEAKMLVTVTNEKYMANLCISQTLLSECKKRNCHLITLSSASKGYINGKSYEKNFKEECIDFVNGLESNERAIILHIDMFSEGIDVSGITAVLPFREMGNRKLTQNIGRGSRLHPIDRMRMYSGEIKPYSDRMIKPFVSVIVPMYLSHSQDFDEKAEKLLKLLRDDMGYLPSEMYCGEDLLPSRESLSAVLKTVKEGNIKSITFEQDMEDGFKSLARDNYTTLLKHKFSWME